MTKQQEPDLIEAAWGIIANAAGSDWNRESPEWRTAAERWRERYHAYLADARPKNEPLEEIGGLKVSLPEAPALRLPQIQKRLADVFAYRQTLTGDETDEDERKNPAYGAEVQFDAYAFADIEYLLKFIHPLYKK